MNGDNTCFYVINYTNVNARYLQFFLFIASNLCWIVYGLKGVSSYYLDSNRRWEMVQSRGGTDDVEHAFSDQRSKNSNPTIQFPTN